MDGCQKQNLLKAAQKAPRLKLPPDCQSAADLILLMWRQPISNLRYEWLARHFSNCPACAFLFEMLVNAQDRALGLRDPEENIQEIAKYHKQVRQTNQDEIFLGDEDLSKLERGS